MNNFSIKIKNIFKSIDNFFKINPHKHWIFLLYVFFIIVSLSLLLSFYLLYEIKNENIFQVKIEQEEQQSLLKENLLKRTIDIYNKKAQKEVDIKNNLSTYIDPSL
jgi:hypothetical protein